MQNLNSLNILSILERKVSNKITKEKEFKYSDGNYVLPELEYSIYYTKNKQEYFILKNKFQEVITPVNPTTLFGEYKIAKVNVPISKFLSSYKLEVTDEDYSNGYIIRYFAQLAGNIKSDIIEINKRNFVKKMRNYRKAQVKWRLTGDSEEVIQSNTESIKLSLKDIPTLDYFLRNKLQYWQEPTDLKSIIMKKIVNLK